MYPVMIFYSDKRELDFFTLAAFGRKICAERALFCDGDLAVLTENRPVDINARAIAVFLDIKSGFGKMKICGEAICVVGAENAAALDLLAENGADAVVCGESPRCTVSLSSIGGDQIIISRQRTVITANGKTADPCEYPFERRGASIHTALLAAGFLTAAGRAAI